MRVALLYNARPAEVGADLPDDAFEEFDGEETITSIAGALRGLGADVEPVLADRRLPWRLDTGAYDFVFNIAEGEGRRCREAVPAAVCELLGLPYTGSDPLTLAVTLDKGVARRLVSPDVPVARGALVATDADFVHLETLVYPVLVKPNDEGSSKGIRDNPVAADFAGAVARCVWLRERYGCAALVEEFLPGVEVTVGVAGNGVDAAVIGAMEIGPATPSDQPFVYGLEVKRDWRRQVRYHVPPRLHPDTRAEVDRLALLAWRLLGCRDLSRFDFRLDGVGNPRFIECNPLPGLNPVSGDVVLCCAPTLAYDRLVQGVLRDAAIRVAGGPDAASVRFGVGPG